MKWVLSNWKYITCLMAPFAPREQPPAAYAVAKPPAPGTLRNDPGAALTTLIPASSASAAGIRRSDGLRTRSVKLISLPPVETCFHGDVAILRRCCEGMKTRLQE